jgi:hypothetical protein
MCANTDDRDDTFSHTEGEREWQPSIALLVPERRREIV